METQSTFRRACRASFGYLMDGMISLGLSNAGGAEVYLKDDGWTAATRDGSLSAHFEHSVAVTADGPYILTLP